MTIPGNRTAPGVKEASLYHAAEPSSREAAGFIERQRCRRSPIAAQAAAASQIGRRAYRLARPCRRRRAPSTPRQCRLRRASIARVRASARPYSGSGPGPIHRGRRLSMYRSAQFFMPSDVTRSYSPARRHTCRPSVLRRSSAARPSAPLELARRTAKEGERPCWWSRGDLNP